LVLMDCQMPEMNGFEATRQIRELESAGRIPGHLPIIALTANTFKGDRKRCLQAGMDDHIGKPFEPKALLHMIARLLAANPGNPQQESPTRPDPPLPTSPASPPISCEGLITPCIPTTKLG
jgi:two-component system, sensor histidine kinase and response regulator